MESNVYIPISEIRVTQFIVDGGTVAEYMRSGQDDYPVGCTKCPKSGIIGMNDGYHRTVALILKGKKEVLASLVACDGCDEVEDYCNKGTRGFGEAKIFFEPHVP